MESPDIDSYVHDQLILDKDAKAVQWRKDHLFSKWRWNHENLHTKKKKIFDPYLSPYTSIYRKLIIDVNTKRKTIKL